MRLRSAIFTFACLGTLATLVGACSKKSTTIATPAGSVTVERSANGGTTTVKGAGAEVHFGKGAVDPASLGLPVYPGATESDTSVSLNPSARTGGGQMVMLATPDSFDRVYAYYKEHMPAGSEKAKVSAGGVQLATFQIGNLHTKDAKSVVIQASGSKVLIQLVHAVRT
jgi:hypothetical protein